MLRALVLTLNDNPAGNMGNAHGGIGRVDVLAAGASRSIGVNAQILFVDVNFDVFVDFGIDKKRCKRSMSPSILIERRDTH